jgi:hypothetical protein
MNIAAKVAQRKQEHPEMYCPQKGCLWKTDGSHCPRHQPQVAPPSEKSMDLFGDLLDKGAAGRHLFSDKHTKDADCKGNINPATQMCNGCGVLHGDPCPTCKGKGFHTETCPDSDANKSVGDSKMNKSVEVLDELVVLSDVMFKGFDKVSQHESRQSAKKDYTRTQRLRPSKNYHPVDTTVALNSANKNWKDKKRSSGDTDAIKDLSKKNYEFSHGRGPVAPKQTEAKPMNLPKSIGKSAKFTFGK